MLTPCPANAESPWINTGTTCSRVCVAAMRLARAHRAAHDRVDDLQVRRVERECEVDGAAGRQQVGTEAHVVLHVARVRRIVGVVELAFELGEQLLRRLAEHVDQHVEAAAVGHAEHHVIHAVGATAADQFVEQRNQAVAAFEREALLADILGVQVAFEAVGLHELLEHALLVIDAEGIVPGGAFELAVHPLALLDVGDVHELRTDAAGVGRLQACDQVAQLEALRACERAGAEFDVEVGASQPVEGRVEVGSGRPWQQADRFEVGCRKRMLHVERVEFRGEVSARAVCSDQLEYACLLLRDRFAGGCFRWREPATVLLLRRLDARDRGRVWLITGFTTLEPGEELLPFRCNAGGVAQPRFVQIVDVGGIATGNRRGRLELLEKTGLGRICAHAATNADEKARRLRALGCARRGRRLPG